MVHDPRVTQQLSRLGGLYRDPARVDRDAASLLKSSVGSHLAPIAAEMVENNGNTSTVLVLQGTIAIHFRGNTYQLLVDIYLPAGYPQRPPVAFVRLAENMYLKENHRHVGSDGKVFLPYLHNWNPQSHNLVEMVVAMSSVFSADPPVFSRAPTAPNSVASTASTASGHSSSVARQQQQQQEAYRRAQQEARLAREAEEANLAAEAARRAEREEQERIRVQQERVREEEERKKQLSEQKRWEEQRTAQVREQVNEKVLKHLREQSRQTQQLVQSDWRDQQRLNLAAEQKIEAQLELYQQQKRELERLLGIAQGCREDITNWLEEYETKHAQEEKIELSADDMVQPASQLHGQMLELSAENAAISDALYFLDRALYMGNLSLQDHLKQVRKLAKRQFLVRAHLIKINQVLLDRGNTRRLNGR